MNLLTNPNPVEPVEFQLKWNNNTSHRGDALTTPLLCCPTLYFVAENSHLSIN